MRENATPVSTTLYLGPWYRKSPYFEATLRHGCRAFDIYNHMYIPAGYTDQEDEYWHLVNHVTLWDVAVERIVEIAGRDGFAFANLLTPRDLSRCPVGQGRYVVLTDEAGGIINDPVLLRLGENRFWLAASDSDILLWAKGVAVHAGFEVEIREPDVSPLQVQGPRSKEVVRDLLGEGALALGYYHCGEFDLDGIPLVVSRTGWTGEVGYELYLCDGSRGAELWERVMEAGRPYGMRPTAPSDPRRIEAGILNYGSDMRLEHNPFEVSGLERLVELDQEADFVGKEALSRIAAAGVSRKLVGIEHEGEPLPTLTEPWPVHAEGRPVGHVTALARSPRLGKDIGYAWVPIRLAALGAEVGLETPAGPAPARVAPLPFLDPRKEIPRA